MSEGRCALSSALRIVSSLSVTGRSSALRSMVMRFPPAVPSLAAWRDLFEYVRPRSFRRGRLDFCVIERRLRRPGEKNRRQHNQPGNEERHIYAKVGKNERRAERAYHACERPDGVVQPQKLPLMLP